MGQYRTSVLFEGMWFPTEEFYEMGYNIISEVYLCDADIESELYISTDSIGANHEGFDSTQMQFYVVNNGPGDLHFDAIAYAADQYYWVDPASADAGSYGSDTITVTLNYAAMPCPQTEGIHEFYVLIIYDDPSVFDTVWVSDTVWHDDNVWINMTDPVPYQRKSAASPATGHITRNYYSGYQCFGFAQGWWSIDQGGSWNPVDHNLDEYTFTWISPDTTLLDMWLRFEIEDMGHTDADTVKNVIVFQPDSQPPDVNWIYPNPTDHFVRGDDVVLKWSATDDHLLAHDSIFYSVSGAVPDWQFIDWHYDYCDMCRFRPIRTRGVES